MGIAVRQPLPYMIFFAPSTLEANQSIRGAAQIMDEVNVKALIVVDRETSSVKYAGSAHYAQEGLRDMVEQGVLNAKPK